MFSFNRPPHTPPTERDPLAEEMALAEARLAGAVARALNALTVKPGDEQVHTDSDRLVALKNAYETLSLKMYLAGGTIWTAALAAVIYGLTKYPDSKELAEQITALGVVGGGLGYYAVLIWRVLTERGIAAEVETIKNRYE